MQKITLEDPITHSTDVLAENVERLRELFPEAFTEGRVDFEVLKQLLGGIVDESEEKYGLNWHGKRQARQLALTPSTGTLRPCPEESVDWDTTQNLMIEGDNLEVLKLLQKSYSGKVKMIYIDPPYNTGKDFVYPDNFRDSIQNYLELTGQVDGEIGKLSSNTEASGRFHTDWLNMLYPRLKLARSLLSLDGAIFITIDDHEVARLRHLCDEIFGEENCFGVLVWQHSVQPKGYAGTFSIHHNFVLCYQRSDDFQLANLERTDAHNKNYSNPDDDPNGPWRSGDVRNALLRPNLQYDITTPSGKTIPHPPKGWRWSRVTLDSKIRTGEIIFSSDETRIVRKIYLNSLKGRTPETILFGKDVGTTRDGASEIKALFDGAVPFDTPKPISLIQHFATLAGVGAGDVVLDFFAGSGSTGHAVMAFGTCPSARYILVQLPEPLDRGNKEQKVAADFCSEVGKPGAITELTKERLRRAGRAIQADSPMFAGDPGFRVFKLDRSNIREWDPNPDDLEAALFDGVDHLHEGRTEQDVLYELLLKLGLDLCVPIEKRTIANKPVHSVGAGTLLVCLATEIAADEVEVLALGMAAWREEQNPAGETTVVFRDSAFADDVAKTNCAAILEQHGLSNVRSL
jgi:adenine-specific DNA-methyltransferase